MRFHPEHIIIEDGKAGRPIGAPRRWTRKADQSLEADPSRSGDLKVARMGFKRKGSLAPFPTFWG